MSIPSNVVGAVAFAVTGLCVLFAARKVHLERTRHNDARLMCLLGLLVIEVRLIVPLHGAAEFAVGIPGVLAVLYGAFTLRQSYAAGLRA